MNQERFDDTWTEFKKYTTQEELVSENDFSFAGPRIGWCPDWRIVKDPETEEYILNPDDSNKFKYSNLIIDQFKVKMKDIGATLIVLKYSDKAVDFIHKIDALIVPGGNDIDPKRYGQENIKAKALETEPLRWEHMVDWFHNTDKKLPIMCICWGYQFLNIIHGGDLIQDIKNPDEHWFKLRTFKVTEGTHLHRALQKTTIQGNCFHHQNLGKISKDLIPNAYDEEDGSIHGLEYPLDGERTIFSILWHPEVKDGLWIDLEYEEENIKIFKYLAQLAINYKESCRS